MPADPVKAPEGDRPGAASHDQDLTTALTASMAAGWAKPIDPEGPPWDGAPSAAVRRARLSARYPGRTLVIASGYPKVRANDTDYPFRASTEYAWLTGDVEPERVLVLFPDGDGHRAELFARDRSDRASLEFYTDRRTGEFWVGPRSGLVALGDRLGLPCRPLAELAAALAPAEKALTLPGLDPAVDAVVPAPVEDTSLPETLAELRLCKDPWEIGQLQQAVDATVRGFEDTLRELPRAQAPAGERWLEGTFWRRARLEGNDVGYSSIVAAGAHATTLHWTRDDGTVRAGELLLLDMGVEARSLYTADVTRTVPVSGRFSPAQRRVYDAVWAAQEAGIAACHPGADFLAPHRAAMRVLAGYLRDWGLLTVTPEESLSEDPEAPGAGLHRRWTLHGTSHMLGLDVHDCAAAREHTYRHGTLAAGMVLTVEPGLYFQTDDLTVPAELRGIGVRIEDDVLITATGARVLSAALPRAAEEVEAWMSSLR